MPTGLTYAIEDGTAVELYDIVTAMITGFMIDFRDGKLRTIEEVRKGLDNDIKCAMDDLAEAYLDKKILTRRTNEELEQADLEAFNQRIASENRYQKSKDETVRKLTNAFNKLDEWVPPSKIANLRLGMMKHLQEQISYESSRSRSLKSVYTPKHGFELRETLLEQNEQEIENYKAKLKEVVRTAKETLEYYEALHSELVRIKKMPPAEPAA